MVIDEFKLNTAQTMVLSIEKILNREKIVNDDR